MRRIVGALIGLLAVGAVVTALAHVMGNRAVPVTQPIAFSHRIHVTKARLGCTTVCHSAATREVYAGLPSKDVCFGCHDPDEETPDKPELTRLASYVDRDEDIPWQRVALVPEHVFFSHRRHVTAGKIDCLRCHAGVADAAGPLSEARLVMRMNNCLDCHKHKGADVDCLACHR